MTPTPTAEPLYRWVVLGAAALIMAIAMGAMVNGIAAYVIPLNELHGWQRGDVAFINLSGLMGLAFGGVAVGRYADRFGTRPMVFAGSVVLGLCYLAASRLDALWQYYAIFFIAGFFGTGAIYPPLMAAVGAWFRTGGGLALGLAAAGQALGQGAAPLLSSLLIGSVGVDGALLWTGIFTLATLLPLALLMREPPAKGSAGGEANSDSDPIPSRILVPRMCLAIFLCCTCMSVPLIHLVPLVQDVCGALPEEASGVAFLMMMVAIFGRVAFGKLADMIGAIPAYMSAVAWMTALVFWFVYVPVLPAFYVYAAIYGFGYAGVMTGVLTTMRAHSEPDRRAWALGLVLMFGWFGHANGGYLGGVLFDWTGNYTASYAMAALAGLANLAVVRTLLAHRNRPGPDRLLGKPAAAH